MPFILAPASWIPPDQEPASAPSGHPASGAPSVDTEKTWNHR